MDYRVQHQVADDLVEGAADELGGQLGAEIVDDEQVAAEKAGDVLVRAAKALNAPLDTFVKIPANQRYPGDLRVLRGLTQPQLANATGLSTTTIGSIERGEVTLSDANAQAIAAALKLSPQTYQQAFERVRTRPPGTPA